MKNVDIKPQNDAYNMALQFVHSVKKNHKR